MDDAVGHAMAGDERFQGGRQAGGVVEVQRKRDGPAQPVLAHERLGPAGQVEAKDLRANPVELARDGRTEIAGAAGDPDRLVLEGMPGFHFAVWPPSTGRLTPVM